MAPRIGPLSLTHPLTLSLLTPYYPLPPYPTSLPPLNLYPLTPPIPLYLPLPPRDPPRDGPLDRASPPYPPLPSTFSPLYPLPLPPYPPLPEMAPQIRPLPLTPPLYPLPLTPLPPSYPLLLRDDPSDRSLSPSPPPSQVWAPDRVSPLPCPSKGQSLG